MQLQYCRILNFRTVSIDHLNRNLIHLWWTDKRSQTVHETFTLLFNDTTIEIIFKNASRLRFQVVMIRHKEMTKTNMNCQISSYRDTHFRIGCLIMSGRKGPIFVYTEHNP